MPKNRQHKAGFVDDYPMGKPYLFYGGSDHLFEDGIEHIPLEKAIVNLPDILNKLEVP